MGQQSEDYFPEDQEEVIPFRRYIQLFMKNLAVIFIFFVLATVFGVIYVSKIPARYSAFAQIIFEQPAASDPLPEKGADPALDAMYFEAEIKTIRSKNVILKVVRDLKLVEFFGSATEEDAVGKVQSMLTVSRSSELSRILNIQVNASAPHTTASIANAVARGYIRANFENSLYGSRDALSWIPQEKENLSDIRANKDSGGEIRQVRRPDFIESLPAFQNDPALKELRSKESELQAEINFLKQRYRNKHPVMIKNRADLIFIQDAAEERKKIILESVKSQVQGERKIANVRLLEEAKVPAAPLPVNRSKYLLMIVLADLVLSFVLIILIDFFDRTVKTMEEIESKGVVLPFLGCVPLLKRKRQNQNAGIEIPFFLKDMPDIEDVFRYIRVAINFSAPPEPLKTLVFSSCLPREGKSFIASSIAVSLALDGNKTLLIDCDIRRPAVHKNFQTDNSSGLTQYLTSDIGFDSVLKKSSVENLTLVTSGPLSSSAAQILSSDRMKQFLEEAGKHFDRIIIDCPSMTGRGDAAAVASLVGQLIMVIGAGQTPIDLIKKNQKQLEEAQIKILGTILNRVDIQKEQRRRRLKQQHSTYNRYYSSEKN